MISDCDQLLWDNKLIAIHMGYRQTGAVYTRRSGSVQIQPDRPPISVRTRIGSNSILLRPLSTLFSMLSQILYASE